MAKDKQGSSLVAAEIAARKFAKGRVGGIVANKIRKQGRPETCLDVPKDTVKFWKSNYDAGDFTKLNVEMSIGRPTIRKAWNEGKSSQENIDKITAFYEARKKAQKILEEQINLVQVFDEEQA